MFRIFTLPAVAAVTLAFAPVAAQAHPKLVSSTPAANAVVAASSRVELRFSEPLIAKLSGAEIVMTRMPGMATMKPMAVSGLAAQVGPDGKTLVVTSMTPLGAGTYKLSWHEIGRAHV